MKTLILPIGAFLLMFGTNVSALRCGTNLLEIGSTDIGSVRRDCAIDHEYVVNNANADIIRIFVKEGNFMHKLIFTDGVLTSLDDDRD